MPLRAVTEEGTDIEASEFGKDDWETLRAQVRVKRHLKMPCCSSQAVLKTSKRGTRFFAHKARAECEWKPETAVHLHLKRLALIAARKAGWEARSEVSGTTENDERWTADILARKGPFTVAVEIQWSGQTNEETLRRQRRYRRSGVRGVWLLRQPGFPISEKLPAACIGGSVEEGLKILIPKWQGSNARDRKEDRFWFQTFNPDCFMQALFERRFRFGIGSVAELRLNIETGVIDCWKCGALTRIVTRLEGKVGPHEICHSLQLADNVPRLTGIIQSAIRHRSDIGSVRERYSRTVGVRYVSNACGHCGVLIGRFFERRAWYNEQETVAEITLPVDADLYGRLAQEHQRWAVWGVGP